VRKKVIGKKRKKGEKKPVGVRARLKAERLN
jgi:hypothetical protein